MSNQSDTQPSGEAQTTAARPTAGDIIDKIASIGVKINNLKTNIEDRMKDATRLLEEKATQSSASIALQEKIEKLNEQLTNSSQENNKLTEELNQLMNINKQLENLEKQVDALVESSGKSSGNLTGGYQYKRNKTRSKRVIKLNNFGLLKSRSKSKKKSKKVKKKQLKSKLKMRAKGKSVKKGGAKKKKSHKKTKKHMKSKKSRRHK
jgi:hypothetical protein